MVLIISHKKENCRAGGSFSFLALIENFDRGF